jgi:hypothetical protein
MKRIASLLCDGNSANGIALTTVAVVTQCLHVHMPTLLLCQWFHPLFSGLSLQETIDELVKFTHVGLISSTDKWCACNSAFVKAFIRSVDVWRFLFSYYIQQWNPLLLLGCQ